MRLRDLVVVAATVLSAGALAPGASAGTVAVAGGSLTWTATPGDANETNIAWYPAHDATPAQYQIDDFPSDLQPGAGCSSDTSHRVICSAAGVDDVVIHAGDGDDFVTVGGAVVNSVDYGVPVPVTATMGEDADTFDATDSLGPMELKGEGGDDHLSGSPADDTLDGGAGDDSLNGARGADTIICGAGIDHVSPDPADTVADDCETTQPACSNGLDDDHDGATDYPTDSSCSSATDRDEANPAQCSDTVDNDGDGFVDFPADVSCSGPDDNGEMTPTDGDGDRITDDVDQCPTEKGDPPTGCANHAPHANNDGILGLHGLRGDVDVLANDSDPDGNPVSLTAFGQPAHGKSLCQGRECQYLPNTTFAGNDSFTYTISDGKGGTTSARVFVRVSKLVHDKGRKVRAGSTRRASHPPAPTAHGALAPPPKPDHVRRISRKVGSYLYSVRYGCSFRLDGSQGMGHFFTQGWMQEQGATHVDQLKVEFREQALGKKYLGLGETTWITQRDITYDTGQLKIADKLSVQYGYKQWLNWPSAGQSPDRGWWPFSGAAQGHRIRLQYKFEWLKHHTYKFNEKLHVVDWTTLPGCLGDPTAD